MEKANVREIPAVTHAGTTVGDVGCGDGVLGLVRAWNLLLRVCAGADVSGTVKRSGHPYTWSPGQEEAAY